MVPRHLSWATTTSRASVVEVASQAVEVVEEAEGQHRQVVEVDPAAVAVGAEGHLHLQDLEAVLAVEEAVDHRAPEAAQEEEEAAVR